MMGTIARQPGQLMAHHVQAPAGYYQTHHPHHHHHHQGQVHQYYTQQAPSQHYGLPLPQPHHLQHYQHPHAHPIQRTLLPPTPPATIPPSTPHSRHQSPVDYKIPVSDDFPSREQFEALLNDYISSLSPKKRDKALIPQKRYDNIRAVLKDPKCTTIESAQFRFWAKKMFRLQDGPDERVCHEGKPVAVRETLYDILTTSHRNAQHGGRDKTSAQVRNVYSWVPKELIARFVRNCPTCIQRRSPNDYPQAQAPRYPREQEHHHHIPRTSSMSMASVEASTPPMHSNYYTTASYAMEPQYSVSLHGNEGPMDLRELRMAHLRASV